MLLFSVFLMGFSMGPQNCTFGFHNLSYCIAIWKWDTSMSLWLNFLMIDIKTLPLKEGPNFSLFLCYFFPYF